jgi:hypothetical protein
MTIADTIKTKLLRAKIVGFLFWVAFAASIFLHKEGGTFFLSLIPFAGFAGTIWYVMFFIRCPRCAAPLGQASMHMSGVFTGKSKLNFCPNCGVNLNEPA